MKLSIMDQNEHSLEYIVISYGLMSDASTYQTNRVKKYLHELNLDIVREIPSNFRVAVQRDHKINTIEFLRKKLPKWDVVEETTVFLPTSMLF